MKPSGSWLSLATQHLVSPVKDFVGAVLGQPSPERRKRHARPERRRARAGATAPAAPTTVAPPAVAVDPRRTLPCDLYLTMGASSVRVFRAGAVDEFAFFQRYGVSDHHDTEFVTRLESADHGTENFKPWGLFRLRGDSHRLPDVDSDSALLQRLRAYGLERLPLARQMAGELQAYDPVRDEPLAGWNRLEPPTTSKTFKKVGERRYSYRDILEILRGELAGPQRVAWVEAAIPPPPPTSPLVHRYYLDSHKQAYLVRDRRGEPRRLFLAETSDEALAAILASGKQVRRFSRRRT